MEEDQSIKQSDSMHRNERTLRETFRSGSPDEVREKVKEVVEKGVAAVAGAIRAFTEKADRDTARGVRSSARSEVEMTRSAIREERPSPYGGIGSTHEGAGAYGSTMGMGGSSLESRREHEFPDIRNTPMAQSDKKLEGKDLSRDTDEE